MLTCPKGPHRVERWATLDLERGEVYGGGDRYTCFVDEGQLDDILRAWQGLIDPKRYLTSGRSRERFKEWREIPFAAGA